MNNILIVSPHMDDEVLGCSSWLVPEGGDDQTHVLYTTATHPDAGAQIGHECAKLRTFTGMRTHWTRFDRINHLDLVGQAPIIMAVEKLINELKPSTVLLPAPSYNQDHRACYDAGLTACRPHDRNWFVPRVLIYEEPETLGSMRRPTPFIPQYFRPLDLREKLVWYHTYESQVRGHRSDVHIKALAQVRGAQANMPLAEAFEVARWVHMD